MKQGTKLLEIYFTDDGKVSVGPNPKIHIASIEVVMENGQMAQVPWAKTVSHDGVVTKWNLAQVLGVTLAPEVINGGPNDKS